MQWNICGGMYFTLTSFCEAFIPIVALPPSISNKKPPYLLIHPPISPPLPFQQHAYGKTEIIENGARTSRISPFGLGGGENTARRFSFSPHSRQGKRNDTTDLSRRGYSNVLAAFASGPVGLQIAGRLSVQARPK